MQSLNPQAPPGEEDRPIPPPEVPGTPAAEDSGEHLEVLTPQHATPTPEVCDTDGVGASPALPELRRSQRKRSLDTAAPEIRKITEPPPQNKRTKKSSMTGRTPPKAPLGARSKEGNTSNPKPTSLEDIKDLIVGVGNKLDRVETSLGARIDNVDARLDEKITEVTDEVSELRQEITSTSGEVRGVARDVEGVKDRLDRNERELEDKIEKVLNKKIKGNRDRLPDHLKSRVRDMAFSFSTSQDKGPSGGQMSSRSAENYWTARRSLCLWPIKGQDLPKEVVDFLEGKLKLGDDFVAEDSIVVKRVRPGRGGKPADEVAVEFPDIPTRDAVRAAALNLAGQQHSGLRLEVP